MLTGIVVGCTSSEPLVHKISVAPIATVETVTPTRSPICCQRELRPPDNQSSSLATVAPAIADAMQTAPPIINARTAYSDWSSARKNIAQVANQRCDAMPLIGFEELPSTRMMRPATVTNKNPNTPRTRPQNRF